MLVFRAYEADQQHRGTTTNARRSGRQQGEEGEEGTHVSRTAESSPEETTSSANQAQLWRGLQEGAERGEAASQRGEERE